MQSNNHKLLSINGMHDHILILFGLRPVQSITDLMQDVKGSSSKCINIKKLVQDKYSWQEGMAHFNLINPKCQQLFNTLFIKLITIKE